MKPAAVPPPLRGLTHLAAIFFVGAAVLVPPFGQAAERPLFGGLTARFRSAGLRRRALIAFRDGALTALTDPRCPAASRLRLATSVTGFTQIDLPCANWRAAAGGYLFADSSGQAGGVHRILLQPDRLFMKLGGRHYATVDGPIPFAEVTLAVGADSVCGRFGTFKHNTAGRVVAAAGSGPCHPRPNFLIINLDDTRADGIDRMPVVQSRLIGEGVQFTESFVPDPLCCPSRASMFSGLYALHHHTRYLAGPIGGAHVFRETGGDQRTMAVWLQAAGYRTGLFGKYLNSYSGTEAHAGPGGTFYVPPGWNRWRGMTSPEHYGGVLGPTYMLVDEHGALTAYDDHTTDDQYATDLLAREVRTFVAEAVSAGRNFFAYYAPYASHVDTPSLIPQPAVRHAGVFANLPPWRPASWLEADVSDKPRWVQALGGSNSFATGFNDLIRQRAYETLLAVDEQIDLFLQELEALGAAEDTVIIFTSDNAVTWGEHRFLGQGKECPYEEAIRVPMVVRYPRRVRIPAVREAAVLNIDVSATVAALAGVPVPTPIDGVAFDSWLGGTPPGGWRADFLLEHWRGDRRGTVFYTGQPMDGDRLRLLYGNPWARPRAAAEFEFDTGDGVGAGRIAVPIGPTADDTFSTLGDLVVAAVPFTSKVLNVTAHQLVINDATPQVYGVQFFEEVNQLAKYAVSYPVPDYFGVRDVANRYAYVEHETGEVELYDLTADPAELQNVAGAPAYAAEQARLAQRLQGLLAENGGP